jgi:hypothetical protein
MSFNPPHALLVHNQKQFHNIYPRAHLKKAGRRAGGWLHQATASRLARRENNNCLMSVAGLAGLNR